MVEVSRNISIFKLSVSTMVMVVGSLPLFAMAFCVLWSLMYDFKMSTATHCRVPNYLPSISAAIGGFTPQLYVWRICIALHASPRVMIAVAYYNFHTSIHVGQNNELYMALAALNSLCHLIEVGSLVGLSFISSLENHSIHEIMFISFMASSLLYMLLTIFLFSWGRSRHGSWMTNEERKSLQRKKIFFGLNIGIFLFSIYIFFRHNWYCEPGVYTVFAACEYLVILTNTAFHGTSSIDFSPFALAYVQTDLIAGQSASARDRSSTVKSS